MNEQCPLIRCQQSSHLPRRSGCILGHYEPKAKVAQTPKRIGEVIQSTQASYPNFASAFPRAIRISAISALPLTSHDNPNAHIPIASNQNTS